MQCLQMCCFVFVQYLARWCLLPFCDIEKLRNVQKFDNLYKCVVVFLALLRSPVSYYLICPTQQRLPFNRGGAEILVLIC